MPDATAQTIPAYYLAQSTDWQTQAAQALSNTATTANTGRDLSACLVGMALGAGVQGKAREVLLNAWKGLNLKPGKPLTWQ